MSAQIRVDACFNGPPGSANGGYVCGLMAAAVNQPLSVRLYKPPPLDIDMELVFDTVSGKWHLKLEEQLIAAANVAHQHTRQHTHVPKPPSYLQALDASVHFSGHHKHAFPNCFVCGPQRAVNEGLRIFAGKLPDSNIVAAPWLPHAALAHGNESNRVRPEFIWAALDCPGYFASVTPGRTAVLGELAVHIDRQVHIEEPCVIIGWQILIEGRKHKVGTALFDEDGEQCAMGVATWVELAG
ncbi:MAG: hypothetical protein QM808_15970 [Steroidobacteraceae bacterium]